MSLPTLPSGGQTVYNFLMNVASQGQPYDIGFNDWITPVVVAQPIYPGLGVAKVIGQDMQVTLPTQNIATVTQSTALVTSNSTVVTLNGIALTPVVYATSNAATLTAIAVLIASQSNVQSAVSNGTNAITITASPGYAVTATFVTTLGAGQPTWTTAYTNSAVFYGIATYIQNKMNLLVFNQGSYGPSPYYPGDPIPCMDRGRIWVTTETTVTSDSPVYWRIIPTISNPQVGSFRGDSDGGNAILLSSTIVEWILGASAGGLAVLQINQP